MTTEIPTRPLAPVKSGHRTLTNAAAEAIRRAIEDGAFARGSQLPPELELMAQLGVSRTTLREALRALEEQGFIVRRRGLGTYVSGPSIIKDLSINFGISEMVTQAGLTPGTQAVEVRRERASASAALALGIAEGEPVIVLDRVRTANGRPVVWSLDILPSALLGERAIEAFHLEAQSVYKYLSDQLQIRIVRGAATLKPIAATSDMAAKLGVRRGTPLMHVAQTDYDAGDRPVLYSLEHHLPDAFVFLVNRKGPHW